MTRRRFVAGLGSTIAMALCPSRLHAQQAGKPRRVWVLRAYGESDREGQLRASANLPNLCRQAAGYVDRVLRGQKPADMPVQQPTKFEMIVNLKGARAIGITLPATLIARADEVIE